MSLLFAGKYMLMMKFCKGVTASLAKGETKLARSDNYPKGGKSLKK